MRATHFIAAGLVAASMPTIFRRLQRRHLWEQRNRRAYLAVHLDQVSIAATRAGLPLGDMLHECRHRGATHVTIAEDTLDSLLQRGELVHLPPVEPGQHRFAASRPGLAARIRTEFAARLPHAMVGSEKNSDDEHVVLAGDLAALRPIALGFDPDLFKMARSTGLQLIASPISYAWSETAAIERTLAQAAQLGARIVAFAGDMVLGHEMRMNDTITSLRRQRLIYAYFADSRHQRGDWFIAKALPEQTLLSYRFTPEQLNAADEGSLAYEAGLRASEGGVRLIFADTDIGVHAIVPTDIYRFLDALAHDLIDHGGFSIDIPAHSHEHDDAAHGHEHDADGHHHHTHDNGGGIPDPLPVEKLVPVVARALTFPPIERTAAPSEYGLMLPAAVGLGLLALDRMQPLPLPVALALGGGAFVLASSLLPRLDRPRDALTATFVPSYAAKLLSLGALVAGPAAGSAGLLGAPAAGFLAAAATASPDYYLRIETLRTLNLDWSLPLAWQLAAEPPSLLAGRKRWLAAALILAGPMLLRSRLPADLLDTLDREHPSGHTHHLSAAQRTLGDARMSLSPQPLRKWSGLTLLWFLHASLPPRSNTRVLVGLAATAGGIAAAGSLRNASRPIVLSIAQILRSEILSAPTLLLGATLAQTRNRVGP